MAQSTFSIVTRSTQHYKWSDIHLFLGKWTTWCTNSFLCIYFYL